MLLNIIQIQAVEQSQIDQKQIKIDQNNKNPEDISNSLKQAINCILFDGGMQEVEKTLDVSLGDTANFPTDLFEKILDYNSRIKRLIDICLLDNPENKQFNISQKMKWEEKIKITIQNFLSLTQLFADQAMNENMDPGLIDALCHHQSIEQIKQNNFLYYQLLINFTKKSQIILEKNEQLDQKFFQIIQEVHIAKLCNQENTQIENFPKSVGNYLTKFLNLMNNIKNYKNKNKNKNKNNELQEFYQTLFFIKATNEQNKYCTLNELKTFLNNIQNFIETYNPYNFPIENTTAFTKTVYNIQYLDCLHDKIKKSINHIFNEIKPRNEYIDKNILNYKKLSDKVFEDLQNHIPKINNLIGKFQIVPEIKNDYYDVTLRYIDQNLTYILKDKTFFQKEFFKTMEDYKNTHFQGEIKEIMNKNNKDNIINLFFINIISQQNISTTLQYAALLYAQKIEQQIKDRMEKILEGFDDQLIWQEIQQKEEKNNKDPQKKIE